MHFIAGGFIENAVINLSYTVWNLLSLPWKTWLFGQILGSCVVASQFVVICQTNALILIDKITPNDRLWSIKLNVGEFKRPLLTFVVTVCALNKSPSASSTTFPDCHSACGWDFCTWLTLMELLLFSSPWKNLFDNGYYVNCSG